MVLQLQCIREVLSYRIENIKEANEEQLSSGVWICLIGVHKSPPHLGVISQGKYYTLRYNGPRIEAVSSVFKKLKRKRVPALFVNIKSTYDAQKLESAFNRYSGLEPGVSSCLVPIKEVIGEHNSLDLSNVNFIFELLPLLKSIKLIGESKGVALENLIKDEGFTLKTYSKSDIANCISELQKD